MTWVAAASAGAGLVGSLVSGNQQAQAAAGAAGARERSAQQQLAFAKESQQKAVAAADSPQQIAILERQLQSQEKNLAREENFLKNIDPTMVEASQQALRLLRGETSTATDPVRQQRDRQRKMLVDQLREQMGPGAETSSAGMQALQNFDFETNQAISGAQQGALGQLLGVTQNAAQMGRQGLSSQQQLGQNIAQGFGDIAQRKTSAFLGGQQAISQAGAQATSAAGSQFVGDQLRGQQMGSMFGSIAQAGLTSAASRMPGAPKPEAK